ncbi:MAG: 16S rRNA (uracil(1498)-N(3))-methyltransferase [Myxococcales bacterium]|nr:16S rRNA (uracil(1498)-N(3))-methyltransferase [Myxococcales bacterium]MCB9756063.1 16S rRNA (uracil(1498)-N(3))-methyltransferase [Myxococcales bacterium]
MNVILVEPADFVDARRVRLTDRRLTHVRKVHRAAVGDTLRVGQVDGALGRGRVVRLDREALELELELDEPPPPALDVTLVVALPRPPSMRKVLQQGTAMGVKRFVFVHCARTEKSYWTASALEPDAIRRDLLLGLEQARDTALPRVAFERRLAEFLAGRYEALARESLVLVAHPDAASPCPRAPTTPVTLVVGPEGGFIPSELERLERAGGRRVTLGPRILRVETATVALLARLSPS